MRTSANTLTFVAVACLPLVSTPAVAQGFDPAAGAQPIAPTASGAVRYLPYEQPYSLPADRSTLPPNVVPERFRTITNTTTTNPTPYAYGATPAPTTAPAATRTVPYAPTPPIAFAKPNLTPEQVIQLEYQNKLVVINAIDAGDVAALQQHFAQIHFWQTSGMYSPGPIDLNFLDACGTARQY